MYQIIWSIGEPETLHRFFFFFLIISFFLSFLHIIFVVFCRCVIASYSTVLRTLHHVQVHDICTGAKHFLFERSCHHVARNTKKNGRNSSTSDNLSHILIDMAQFLSYFSFFISRPLRNLQLWFCPHYHDAICVTYHKSSNNFKGNI